MTVKVSFYIEIKKRNLIENNIFSLLLSFSLYIVCYILYVKNGKERKDQTKIDNIDYGSKGQRN